LRAEAGLVVAENEPYQVSDETDYGVPVHAEAGGLDYAEIEIRQDLIADDAGQELWAARLARLLPAAWDRLGRLE
jgi:predicted N-formylglutamate amidohydrolase